jgi:hypothetical protein
MDVYLNIFFLDTIEEMIGSGTTAIIYKASLNDSLEKVAVKK